MTRWDQPRGVAIAAVIALILMGFMVPMLALSGAATLVVVGLVALWDTLTHRNAVRPGQKSPT
jgi:hypothetical protein